MPKRLAFLCILQLILGTTAFAQNFNDLLRIFGGVMQQSMIQAAQSEWRKLPPSEVACVDQALRQQSASVEALIHAGVMPSDPRLSRLRSDCRGQFAQRPQSISRQAPVYVVDGIALGGQVRFGSQGYQEYQCSPSEQSPGFIWCHKEKTENSRRGGITSSNSILHGPDGTAVYLNRYIEPVIFGANEVRKEIDRLSTKFGEPAREFRLPEREGLPNAVIAVWGKIQLEQLDPSDVSIIAAGGSPQKGLLVSFLGDLRRSAKLKVPVFRLAGGAGFLWSASFNKDGRGNLRFLSIDASQIGAAISPITTPSPPAAPPPPQPTTPSSLPTLADDLGIKSAFEQCRGSKDLNIKASSCSFVIQNSKNRSQMERAYNSRGLANMGLKNYANAVQDFSHAIQLDKENAGYLDNRQSAFFALGQFNRALQDANRAVKLAPKQAFVYRSRGLIFGELHSYEGAINDLTTAISLEPDWIELLVDRGQLCTKARRFDAAISDFDRALELNPTLTRANRERGMTYKIIGDQAKARADLLIALRSEPDDVEVSDALRELQEVPVVSPAPPPPKPAPVETTILAEAREFLGDTQGFVAAQGSIERITDIAREAAKLRMALDRFDEAAAIQSTKNLKDLLEPVPGFTGFVQQKQAERQRERARRLVVVSAEANKNIYFVDEFLRKNLTDKRTEQLLRQREQLDTSLKSQSIDEITRANDGLQRYLSENALSDQYRDITQNYRIPTPSLPNQPPKSPEEVFGPTDKSRYAITGPEDDIVLIYNASPSAPSVAKDILGRLVFLTGTASLCFAQSTPDDNHIWFVERFLREQGAADINRAAQPCDVPRDADATDIIAFTRGELRKQRPEYILGVVNLLENDTFREYRIVTANEYASDIQDRRALSLKIAQEVERNERAGYGVLIVTDAPIPACIVTPSQLHHTEGLKKLLSDKRIVISMKLLSNWQFVEMSVEDAFIAVMRQQCGYVAGEAGALRTLMGALRRERKLYEFAPVWFETEQVAALSAELIHQKGQEEAAARAKKAIEDARNEKLQVQKSAVELRLRNENGPRARALKDRIHKLIHDLPKDDAEKAERRVVEVARLFPQYLTWLNKRFADQWETLEVTSDIDDFGVVQWRERPLDGVIVKTVVKQRNRILGANKTDCFFLGLVDDAEFSMQRDPFALPCENNERAITNWKVRRQFKSKWNWEPEH